MFISGFSPIRVRPRAIAGGGPQASRPKQEAAASRSDSGTYTISFSRNGKVGHGSDGPIYGKAKVLLISGDDKLIKKMEGLISGLDHEYLFLPPNNETLLLLRNVQVNLTIIDVGKKELADEMVERIKHQLPGAKIIVLTEYDPVEAGGAVKASQNVDCYLEKKEAENGLPFLIELLLSQQQLEFERNKAREVAAEQTRLADIGLGAAAVAHEINNQLTGLHGALYLIGEALNREGAALASYKKIKGYIDGALTGLEHIKAIIQTIQDLGRGNAADSLYSINEVVLGVKALSAADLRRKSVVLQMEMDESNPMVFGKKQKLMQIVLNLINNACHAVAEEGKIIVMTKRTEDGISLAVSDNGSGIAAEALPHIFKPFYTTKSEKEGTGLGLYIVRKLVEELGGTISVATKIGGGTTFTVFIPPTTN
ncbi:MAG: HAMP domain-containing sensor histidine kinase [Candidatus Margulisiibacteriota bacterium]|jgi:signal transduction histidine kinase